MKGWCLAAIPFLMLAGPAANAQNVAVSVSDRTGNPVPSQVFFRRSSSASWERLGDTNATGQLIATLACQPGTVIYADPVAGRYFNSEQATCQATLPLEVRPRQNAVYSAVLPLLRASGTGVVTREDLALAAGTVEATDFDRLGAQNTALHAFLRSPDSISSDRAALIQTNLLNDSAALYEQADRNSDGQLNAVEIQAAIAASPE